MAKEINYISNDIEDCWNNKNLLKYIQIQIFIKIK